MTKKALLTLVLSTLILLSAPKPISAAKLMFSSANFSTSVNLTTTVTVKLDTQGKDTTGADAVITFNPDIIEVQSVEFVGPYAHNFHSVTGGTLKLTSTFAISSQYFNGNQDLAQITFKGKKNGSGILSFVCSQGATNDSNVSQRISAQDLIVCTDLKSTTITVSGSGVGGASTTSESTSLSTTSDSTTVQTTPDDAASPTSDTLLPSETDEHLPILDQQDPDLENIYTTASGESAETSPSKSSPLRTVLIGLLIIVIVGGAAYWFILHKQSQNRLYDQPDSPPPPTPMS